MQPDKQISNFTRTPLQNELLDLKSRIKDAVLPESPIKLALPLLTWQDKCSH